MVLIRVTPKILHQYFFKLCNTSIMATCMYSFLRSLITLHNKNKYIYPVTYTEEIEGDTNYALPIYRIVLP